MTGPGNRETPHYAETPRRGIDSFADGRRSWQAYAEHLEDRCGRAEEALREIRWLHHDDSKTYQQLFVEAARIAEAALAAVPEKDKP